MSDDSEQAVRAILWRDATMENIELGSDVIALQIQDSLGAGERVECAGHIGVQMIGFWDESIIENAALHSVHPFIFECERRLGQLPAGESGSPARARTGNRLLEIVFLDGCKLWICASQFRCSMQ